MASTTPCVCGHSRKTHRKFFGVYFCGDRCCCHAYHQQAPTP